MIVLPLILGIGIDDGVHVVHDFLQQASNSYRVSNATAVAVVLTSATTVARPSHNRLSGGRSRIQMPNGLTYMLNDIAR